MIPSILAGFKELTRTDPPPAEFTVTDGQVPALADEIYAASNPNAGLGRQSRPEIARNLRAGRVKCFGIPVRVVSVKRKKDQGHD